MESPVLKKFLAVVFMSGLSSIAFASPQDGSTSGSEGADELTTNADCARMCSHCAGYEFVKGNGANGSCKCVNPCGNSPKD